MKEYEKIAEKGGVQVSAVVQSLDRLARLASTTEHTGLFVVEWELSRNRGEFDSSRLQSIEESLQKLGVFPSDNSLRLSHFIFKLEGASNSDYTIWLKGLVQDTRYKEILEYGPEPVRGGPSLADFALNLKRHTPEHGIGLTSSSVCRINHRGRFVDPLSEPASSKMSSVKTGFIIMGIKLGEVFAPNIAYRGEIPRKNKSKRRERVANLYANFYANHDLAEFFDLMRDFSEQLSE